MNFPVFALVIMAYPIMLGILGRLGGASVIAAVEKHVRLLGGLAATHAEDFWYQQIIPRIRSMCLVMIAGLWLAVVLAALVALEVPDLLWNLVPTILVAIVFSAWLLWVRYARAEMPETTAVVPTPVRPDPSPASFSVSGFLNASFAGFMTMGMVEFYVGNRSHSRPIVQIGTFYLLFAMLGMLKTGVKFVVKLAAMGIFSLEGMTNLVTSLAVGLVTIGKSSLKDVFGPTGAQIAKEEYWVGYADAKMSRLIASVFPMLIFCNLLPGLDVLGAMTMVGGIIFMLWGNLESSNIQTWYLRQRAAITVYRVGYALMIVVALILLVPGLQEQFNALRQTGNELVIGVFQGTNNGIKSSMAGLVAVIISGGLLYFVWPKEGAPLATVRMIAGFMLGLVVLFCVGKVIWTFVEPDLRGVSAAVKQVFTQPPRPQKTATAGSTGGSAKGGVSRHAGGSGDDELEICKLDPEVCRRK